MKDHIVLCGFGHVGYRIFVLLARLGQQVVILANQEPERWLLTSSPEFQFIVGDGKDDRNLIRAGIQEARTIIAVTNDDMTNVTIALDAKRLNPRIRTVVRLSDRDLALYLEKNVGIDRALCTPSLCVPMFVAAALGGRMLGSIEASGSYYPIEEVQVRLPEAGSRVTLEEWCTESRKAAIAAFREGEILVGPAESLHLQDGDSVTCLGLPTRRATEATGSRGASGGKLFGDGLYLATHGLRGWWRDAPKALRTALIALSIVVLGSICVFHVGLGMSVLDATYFVVTIVSTTGFGDFNLMSAPDPIKIYGIFLMLCGAAVVATLFSILSDIVVSTRFRDVLTKGCSRYKGHFIVAGLGNIGLGVLRELVHSGERAVAIEVNENSKFVETAKSLAPVVLGNVRTEETLRKAGIGGAKVLIAVTDNDISNLSSSLAARRMNSDVHTVMRIFDANLADKMCCSLRTNAVLSTSAAASPTFVGAALVPEVLFGFVCHDYLIVIFRRRFDQSSDDPALITSKCADCETVLLTRTGGSGYSLPLHVSGEESDFEECIGSRWYRLQEDSPI
ncbi:MAG: TrkA family potassium uptake protein [Syntrophobacteraceae bacterium]